MDAASTDWTAHPRPPDRLHLTEHRCKTFSLYYLRHAHDFSYFMCLAFVFYGYAINAHSFIHPFIHAGI